LDNEKVNERIFENKSFKVLCASYPNIIPIRLIDLLQGHALNFNTARLPKYRGCFPKIGPILNGGFDAD
jgi:methionyl-tRNA formyltransferase